jgi:hypothetical protein
VGFPEFLDTDEHESITSLFFLMIIGKHQKAFTEKPTENKIRWVSCPLVTKDQSRYFLLRFLPGSLESMPTLEGASGARMPWFWEFGSCLKLRAPSMLPFWPRSPDQGGFF